MTTKKDDTLTTDTIKVNKKQLRSVLKELLPAGTMCDPELIQEHAKALVSLAEGQKAQAKEIQELKELVHAGFSKVEEHYEKLTISMTQNRDEGQKKDQSLSDRITTLEVAKSTTLKNIVMVCTVISAIGVLAGLAFGVYQLSQKIDRVESAIEERPEVTEVIWNTETEHEAD